MKCLSRFPHARGTHFARYYRYVKNVTFPALLAVVIASTLVFTGCSKPTLEVTTPSATLGQATPVSVHVHASGGVKSVTATIEQNGQHFTAWQMNEATKTRDTSYNFLAGTKAAPQLQDGPAKLVVEAKANGAFGQSAQWTKDFTVVTRPPSVSADSDVHYLYVGMADLATLNVMGNWTEAGVKVGEQKFRAWPMPGGKPGMFSLYAFAWNMPAGTQPLVYASNAAGNDVTTPLNVEFPKKEQPRYTVHELQIDDRFMQKVVGELDPNGTGDIVARFVKINNDMRKANNKTLSDLAAKTADHFLWSQPFLRQAAKTEATFADHRKYIYQGKLIDEQTHLGYDLASTQHAGVIASNDGRVVYAAPLGIYGNCVVVDHGYGLQTIYGHMSRIDVKEGDDVKRGQVMGQSGMTGMAGGDHIHFSMQLDGVQIDPKEWWDPHWIKDHVVKRVDIPFHE
jgi:murein DD-endopeptidase MepM/ murein hydrolase activator NlpD